MFVYYMNTLSFISINATLYTIPTNFAYVYYILYAYYRDCDYHYSGLGIKGAYPGRGHSDSPGCDRGVYVRLYMCISTHIHS